MNDLFVNGIRGRAVTQAEFCKVFGNVQRVLILWSLAKGELPVSEIASLVDGSLQNTSQHLHLMKSNGILTSRRDGQMIYYRIAENELMENCPLLDHSPHEEHA